MNPKLIKMCGPCGDVPVLKTIAMDCATGQPSTLGATCATPLFVKSCDPVQQDCEIALAMNPSTLEIVVVTLCFVGGVPTTTLTNVDGSPYVGPQPIALDKEWNFQTHTLCDGGAQTVTRTDVFVDGGQAPSFSIWQDITGAVIPAPAPGDTLAWGPCPEVTPAPTIRIIKMGWQQIVGAPFSLADALAMGGSKILSYTIKQISGQGTINGDAGGGVLIDAGEAWSGGTGKDDVLSTVTSFNPGSGTMRLTWQYI